MAQKNTRLIMLMLVLAATAILNMNCRSSASRSDENDVRLDEASKSLAGGDYREAIDILDGLDKEQIRDRAFHQRVLYMKVVALMNLRQWDRALSTAKRCARMYPDTGLGIFCEAMIPNILVRMDRKRQATAAYEAFIRKWKRKQYLALEGIMRSRAQLAPESYLWLHKLLSDEAPYARASAITVLREIEGKGAIASIKALLEDPAPLVQAVAARNLWELGDRAGLQPMLALARNPAISQVGSADEAIVFAQEEVVCFLARTRDPIAQIEAIRIVRESRNYGLMSRLSAPHADESWQLEPWSVSYLMPLLDDRKSTGIHQMREGWAAIIEMRVCDIAAQLITEILAGKLPPYASTCASTAELDAQIASIKAWWSKHSADYSVPPKAKAVAKQTGL